MDKTGVYGDSLDTLPDECTVSVSGPRERDPEGRSEVVSVHTTSTEETGREGQNTNREKRHTDELRRNRHAK